MRVAGLLGGHVPDRAELRPGAGQALLARQPGQPEVEQLGLPVRRDQHVRRLQVAVDQAEPVRLDQRVRDLVGDVAREPDGQRGDRRGLLQVGARDQLHHEVRDGRTVDVAGRLLARVDRGDDVRVLEPPDGPRLEEEPGQGPRVLIGGRGQRLHRDRGAQLPVLGAVHHAHPPDADPVEEPVVAEHEPVQPAGPHPFRLEAGQQPGGPQGLDHRVVGRRAVHGRPVGQGVKVFRRHDPGRQQAAEQERCGPRRRDARDVQWQMAEGRSTHGSPIPCRPDGGPSRNRSPFLLSRSPSPGGAADEGLTRVSYRRILSGICPDNTNDQQKAASRYSSTDTLLPNVANIAPCLIGSPAVERLFV
ncbi:hypothetical protein FTUN_4130 [Frigoriglobus tundricola]|uniref:Uncharacterized protein n=1 Tax=Frigoriglobus tundricola TaxID=2774151 RepID=A0A6M5YTB9_9BACT|nr:hypothetical protein FTUN_4130 [Frigoriglobus tundricola]